MPPGAWRFFGVAKVTTLETQGNHMGRPHAEGRFDDDDDEVGACVCVHGYFMDVLQC